MKRLLLFLALLGLACSSTPFISKTATAVAASITALPVATITSQPTQTTAPTATLPPTATPLPPVINADNAAQLEKLAEIASPSIRKVVFSPDGTLFASGAGNEADFGIKIWQSQDAALLHSMNDFSGIVWDLAFSPDGKVIASVADDQNGSRLRIWNVAAGTQISSLNAPPTTSSVAFSPDGSRLAVGGLNGWPNGTIWIYDTKSWTVEKQLTAAGQNVTGLVFTRDGSQLISSGTDGLIRLWSVPTGNVEKQMSSGKQANRLALSADGSLLASSFCTKTDTSGCIQGGIAVWRTSDWTIIQKFEDIAESLAFSPDSRLLVSGSGANDPRIRIRRVEDWGLVKEIPGEGLSVALSPDDRYLISTQWEKITVWGLR